MAKCYKRVFSLLLLLLTGCTWLQPTDSSIQQKIDVRLLPKPSALKENFFATQRAKGQYKNARYSLQMNLEKNTDQVVLVALGQMGVVLFSVSYDGETIDSATSHLIPQGMDPAYVLRDFLWAYWPLQSIEEAFLDTSFSVEENHGERWIFDQGQPLLSVHYGDDPWGGTVRLKNVLRGYSLKIDTFMREPL